jgi:hypothetical protein
VVRDCLGEQTALAQTRQVQFRNRLLTPEQLREWSSQGVLVHDEIRQVVSQVRKVSESSAEKATDGQLLSAGVVSIGKLMEVQNNHCRVEIERTDSLEFSNISQKHRGESCLSLAADKEAQSDTERKITQNNFKTLNSEETMPDAELSEEEPPAIELVLNRK